MKRLIFFILALIFLWSAPFLTWADGSVYYVDADADPGGDGSTQATTGPNCAFDAVADVVAASLVADDVVFFQRGDTWEGTTEFDISWSGSDGSPITFGAYGTGNKPIISYWTALAGWTVGGNWTDNSGSVADTWYIGSITVDPGRLWLDDTEYIEAENEAGITSTYRWWYDAGNDRIYVYATENPSTMYSDMDHARPGWRLIDINNQDYITFENLDIRGGYYSIQSRNGSSNIIVDTCDVGLNAWNAIYLQGSDNEVKDCTIASGWSSASATWDLDVHDGVTISGISYVADDNLIHNNTISDWGHNGVTITCTDASTANNNLIYLNTISGTNSNYMRGFGVSGTSVGVCQNNEIYRNYIYDTTVHSQFKSNATKFYYNIINIVRGCAYASIEGNGITLYSDGAVFCEDNEIYNNVIYNTAGSSIALEASGIQNPTDGHIITNNLFMNWGAGYYGLELDDDADLGACTYENNLLYKSGVSDVVDYRGVDRTIAEFNAENGNNSDVIANNISSDPLMTNPGGDDFTLQFGSPCINRGTHLGLFLDYLGLPVPIGHQPDIGAYEHKNGGRIF